MVALSIPRQQARWNVIDPVPELQELLGGQPVFIKWPKGKKGTNKKWKHLTAADMTPKHLAALRSGNIGVALGRVSGGLCVVDADVDSFADSLALANPCLRNTLQTRGARGRAFWIRFRGEFPNTRYLESREGGMLGEFRSNGAQSIVWGTHPETGRQYQILVRAKVLTIDFAEIHWPPEVANPPSLEGLLQGCTEEPEETDEAEETDEPDDPDVVPKERWWFSVHTLEEALDVSLPNHPQENNRALFVLARGVKALEIQREQRFTPAELLDTFNQWFTRVNKEFLRAGQTEEEYRIEFLNAYARAKYPLGSAILKSAWERACAAPPPPEALKFDTEDLRLVIGLCFQLQLIQGAKPFFLSGRTCARLLGHKSHTTAADWLKALCALQILGIAERGTAVLATRYFYLPCFRNRDGAVEGKSGMGQIETSITVAK